MLSREEADRRLQGMPRASRPVSGNPLRMPAAKALASSLGLRRDGVVDLQAAGTRIDAMRWRERRGTLNLLLGGWGDEFCEMWGAGVRLPYQTGWERRAFRAPDDPAVSREARASRLAAVVRALLPYQDDGPVWLARWAPYVSWGNGVGSLLASVIDAGGKTGDGVFELLIASAEGTDEVGAMGRHVVTGLLGAAREDGWEYLCRLLLSAQRQEGLRQTILEAADESHPDAFDRILGLVLEHDLTRFSSAARAISVWLGAPEMAGDMKRMRLILERLLRFRTDQAAAAAGVRSDDPQELFVALTATAMRDAPEACRLAAAALPSAQSADRRFAIVYLLSQLRLGAAAAPLADALRDGDLPVSVQAMRGLANGKGDLPDSTLPAVTALIERIGKKGQTLEPRAWPWTAGKVTCEEPCELLLRLAGSERVEWTLPYLDAMNSVQRRRVAKALGEQKIASAERRVAILRLVGDAASGVREQAIKTAATVAVTDAEAVELELLLSRKATDLRRGVIALLAARGSGAAVASAQRLRSDKDPQRRLAGVELLRQMSEAGDAQARRLLQEQNDNVGAADEEAAAIKRAGAASTTALTMDDGLGLVDASGLTAPAMPSRVNVQLVSRRAADSASGLDDLLEANKQEPVEVEQWDGRKESKLLGDIHIESPLARGQRRHGSATPAEGADPGARLMALAEQRVHLLATWLNWESSRPGDQRDGDGFELARALLLPIRVTGYNNRQMQLGLSPTVSEALSLEAVLSLAHGQSVRSVLEWLIVLRPPPGIADFLLDAAEQLLARVPHETLKYTTLERYGRTEVIDPWRRHGWLAGLNLAETHRRQRPDVWSDEQQRRLWGLQLWAEDPVASGITREQVVRVAIGADELAAAHRCGIATEPDVISHVLREDLRPRRQSWHGSGASYGVLARLSGRTPGRLGEPTTATLDALVRQCVARVIEVELDRGEAPSVATAAAKAVRHAGGLEVLVTTLERLGRESFVRGWSWSDSESRKASFSHIVRATYPGADDTVEAFATRIGNTKLTAKRLLELAAYAPQWAPHVEASIGQPGVVDAVWWFHAHTKDNKWSVDADLREAWAAETSERTPLTSADLVDGACDVEWFRRAYERAGDKLWGKLDQAAKYCSSAGGHTRAQLFARSMLGNVDEGDLTSRIREKRHQDSVRALGLLPLPGEPEAREAVLLRRYAAVQEFVRTSRQFGSQRKASEKRAADIALANLARTAGYRDPLRLEWAMEAARIADLVDQPATATADDVTVSLAITNAGEPELTVKRGDKPLKSVPTKLSKNADIAELRTRATDLRRQRSRIRSSLEQMMVRGDEFTGAELRELCRHPLVFPLLASLVVLGDGAAGLPQPDGQTLTDHSGRIVAVGGSEPLRIAHPHDLMELGLWSGWQQRVLGDKLRQPIKQVFRELYPITQAERNTGDHSARYAGHQIQPRAALALLGGRGWVAHPEEGVRRAFHHEGLTASLWFRDGFGTPLEMEAPTIEQVRFSKIGDWQAVPLDSVPPRLFSEVMRDLDLVVSVAHIGGVDPEASASTVEMRAALVSETARLLRLENVKLAEPRVLISGKLGDYSVHLGSAVVHRQPGGSVCIVPVHSQHRGRLFLPFADDDPKTAEVVSKILLLANDHEIRDPMILEQLQQV